MEKRVFYVVQTEGGTIHRDDECEGINSSRIWRWTFLKAYGIIDEWGCIEGDYEILMEFPHKYTDSSNKVQINVPDGYYFQWENGSSTDIFDSLEEMMEDYQPEASVDVETYCQYEDMRDRMFAALRSVDAPVNSFSTTRKALDWQIFKIECEDELKEPDMEAFMKRFMKLIERLKK